MRNPGLEQVLTNLVNEAGKSNWKIIHDYHFGGFAKTTESLIHFINQFWIDYNIPLDPVYTGKMMFALQEMLNTRGNRRFKKNSSNSYRRSPGYYCL